jgi:hypothetical protein
MSDGELTSAGKQTAANGRAPADHLRRSSMIAGVDEVSLDEVEPIVI